MNKIKELEKQIKHHKSLYYQGRPEISDSEFDRLEEELRKVAPESPVLKMVGTSARAENKVKHKSKMLSLGKTYKVDDLKKWIDNREVVSMFKLDGVSCSLIYKKGTLVMAKTRGDGLQGERITDKVNWMECIPQEVATSGEEVEVRGELYCDEENFVTLSDKMEELGLQRPSNQRNIVAGLMGRKENVFLSQYIQFQAFELLDPSAKFKKEEEKFLELKKQGFIVPEIEVHRNEEKIDEVINEAQKFMAEGDYQIDGLVFVVNDLEEQNDLGETSHHPRYKIAFKFEGETKTTHIQKILWQVARNGILTPVAKVEPVELSGAKISSVTLHNYGMVRQFNLKKGDKIEIMRSGEVIPKFISVVSGSKNKFEVPRKCPSCEEAIEEVDIRLICKNEKCPAKVMEAALNFIKKIGIDDLSSKRLEEMLEKKLITQVSDLYHLKEEDFLKLDKVKEKLASKLYKNIQKTKETDLVTFLSSLGISGGAKNKCEKIVHNGHDSIEKVLNLTIDDLLKVESFAEKSAGEFLSSFEEKKPLVKKLLQAGFQIEKNKVKESKITGKKICITGALSEKRSVIEDRLRALGAIAVSGVSKNTDYLVTNEQDGSSSKLKKAKQLEIKIISEKELKSLTGG